jgi:hypothetical protein
MSVSFARMPDAEKIRIRNTQNAHSGWVDWYLNRTSSKAVFSKAAAVEMCSCRSSVGRRKTYDERKISQHNARIPGT